MPRVQPGHVREYALKHDVLVVSPFRRPTFRLAVSSAYPFEEPWDSPPFITAGAVEAAGFEAAYLPLQNMFVSYLHARDSDTLKRLMEANQARILLFSSDHFIASRSTAGLFGLRVLTELLGELEFRPIVGVVRRLATTLSHRLFDLVPGVDFVVIGESETIVGELVVSILRHGLSKIHHPSCLVRGESTRKTPEPTLVATLDSVPMPAFHLVDDALNSYVQATRREIVTLPFSLRTSAGCKFACRFCAGVPYWNSYRTKSPARIEAEVDALVKYGRGVTRLSFLEDEIFTLELAHVQAVCDLFRRRGVVLDGVYTHSSLLTGPAAEALRPVARHVFLGMDNADDTILKALGKGQTLQTVVEAVKIATAAHLRVHLEWIIGTPPEDVDSLIGSLNSIFVLLATGAVDSLNTYVFCPHPGTAYGQGETFAIEEYEQMLESGGFPMGRYSKLTPNQVYVAYLISQILIHEATLAQGTRIASGFVGLANVPALREIFTRVASGSTQSSLNIPGAA